MSLVVMLLSHIGHSDSVHRVRHIRVNKQFRVCYLTRHIKLQPLFIASVPSNRSFGQKLYSVIYSVDSSSVQ